MSSALTFITLQAGWFACVLGAAAGRPLLGVVFVALVAVVHLVRRDDRRGLAFMLGAATVVGLVSDGSLALAGILVFPPQAALGWPVPIWMLALWVNFALAIDSLAWFAPRPLLAALAGAVGGPLSYLAGARLGAVTLLPSEPVALAVIAVVWLLAMPLLLCVLPAFAARAASAAEGLALDGPTGHPPAALQPSPARSSKESL